MSSFVIDPTMQAAMTALDGLSQRQTAISRNMANIDTPGYHAQTVSFEQALQQALHTQSRLPMEVTDAAHLSGVNRSPAVISQVSRPGGSERADGNNVDLDVELTDMAQTGISYQAVTTAVNLKLDLLKTIASR